MDKKIEIEPDYNILREQLLLVAKKENACEGVITQINTIKDLVTFKRAYEKTVLAICERFGIELKDEDEEDLKDQLEDMESERDSLQDEVDEYKERYGEITTLWEEKKVEHFLNFKEKYTEWDLERLLQNGEKFLQLKVA